LSRPDPLTTALARVATASKLPAVAHLLRKNVKQLKPMLDKAAVRLIKVDYASGANRPPDARAFARIGQPFGVAASECPAACEASILEARETRTPVFLDSGAVAELGGPEITDAQWRVRLALYARLADALGDLLTVVAPDKVGDQRATLERLERYREEIRALRHKRVTVLVALQPGELDVFEMHKAVTRALESAEWTPAFPSRRKFATPPDVLSAYAARHRPERIHLLGLGTNNKDAGGYIDAIMAASPDTRITLDSNKITAKAGHTGGVGGGARPLTVAELDVADEVRAAQWSENDAVVSDDGLPLGDFTEEVFTPTRWLTPAELDALLSKMDWLSPAERQAAAEDIDGFVSGEGMNDWTMALLREAWSHRNQAQTVSSRRQEATERAFARPKGISKRVKLVPATTRDLHPYFRTRHYIGRARQQEGADRSRGRLFGYWVVLDATAAEVERMADLHPIPAGKGRPWTLGGRHVAGAVLFAGVPASVRIYGYPHNDLIELARLYLEPDPRTGENPRMLAGAVMGRAHKQILRDWPRKYPGTHTRAFVSYADSTRHDGAIYKGAGYVYVGMTQGHKARGGHEDYQNPKHIYVLPIEPAPTTREAHHLRLTVWGLSREDALDLWEWVADEARAMNLEVPPLKKRPDRGRFDWMDTPEAPVAELTFGLKRWVQRGDPWAWESPEGMRRAAQDLHQAAQQRLIRYAPVPADALPLIQQEIITVEPQNYRRDKATGNWQPKARRESSSEDTVLPRIRYRLNPDRAQALIHAAGHLAAPELVAFLERHSNALNTLLSRRDVGQPSARFSRPRRSR
jgi:hypothetical protein